MDFYCKDFRENSYHGYAMREVSMNSTSVWDWERLLRYWLCGKNSSFLSPWNFAHAKTAVRTLTRQNFRIINVMVCCLIAPSHYVNQYSHIISKVQWHSYCMRAISQEIPYPSITNDSLKIIYQKFNPNVRVANELSQCYLTSSSTSGCLFVALGHFRKGIQLFHKLQGRLAAP